MKFRSDAYGVFISGRLAPSGFSVILVFMIVVFTASRARVVHDPSGFQVLFAPLCRLYENGSDPVSNSYALRSRFGTAQRRLEDPMGVIPSGTVRNAAIDTEPRTFWQRIAQAIDRSMAQRSQRAVPTPVLRQSRNAIKRCHQLISQASPIAVSGETGRTPRPTAAPTLQIRS